VTIPRRACSQPNAPASIQFLTTNNRKVELHEPLMEQCAVGNAIRLDPEERPAINTAEEEIADLLFGDGQGMLFYRTA